ncbi:hypothetical protein SAMN04489715_0385 [Schaalia meyeri]|nr:hypothetical protein SAMN04489715_0385 [Schaalia meyeri]
MSNYDDRVQLLFAAMSASKEGMAIARTLTLRWTRR